jgi:hypothetical protein
VRNVAEFLSAMERVEGGTAFDPAVARMLVRGQRRSTLDELTDRGCTVLSLIAEGHSNRGIARRAVLAELLRRAGEHGTGIRPSPQLTPARHASQHAKRGNCLSSVAQKERRRPLESAAPRGLQECGRWSSAGALRRLGPASSRHRGAL